MDCTDVMSVTDCALSGAESLVGTKGSEQAVHVLRKTEGPAAALLCVSIILPSPNCWNLFQRRRAPDKQAQFVRAGEKKGYYTESF
jgi:hypothetical protein